MTRQNRTPEPEVLQHLVAVLDSLVELLAEFGNEAKAEWLSAHLATLEKACTPDERVASAVRELHEVVLGMGGLMDVHLVGNSPEETEELNARLEELADQLYELTR